MKRLFALMTVLVCLSLCAPSAYADDSKGVFVPTFKTFMSTLYPALQSIDSDFADVVAEEYYIDGKWTTPKYVTAYYYDKHWNKIEFELVERSGFVYSVDITMPIEKMDEWETLFKAVMVAVATSLVPDTDIDFEQALFDGLYYDYVINSPVSYVSMDCNFGVYQFTLRKSSGDLQYRVYLYIPETE